MDVTFLGYKIGTASCWEETGYAGAQFYDFVPVEGLTGSFAKLESSSCLAIDPFEHGDFISYGDDGREVARFPIKIG